MSYYPLHFLVSSAFAPMFILIDRPALAFVPALCKFLQISNHSRRLRPERSFRRIQRAVARFLETVCRRRKSRGARAWGQRTPLRERERESPGERKRERERERQGGGWNSLLQR